ncbi:MAG TPA: ATP-binding protein [Acidimicrobiales bacterium]|nr:ATP-binding protein [Acidimicrobiales bacterium]
MIRRFAHDPSEIPEARKMVRAQLEAWGLPAEQAPLELAVSELVTNAIVHGWGLIDVSMSFDDGCIRLEVADEGLAGPAGWPEPRAGRPPNGVGGWGLSLVEHLSDAWGHSLDGGTTRVWMERRAGAHSLPARPL